ncbi:unnamed protein product, partial [Allacma fusca]
MTNDLGTTHEKDDDIQLKVTFKRSIEIAYHKIWEIEQCNGPFEKNSHNSSVTPRANSRVLESVDLLLSSLLVSPSPDPIADYNGAGICQYNKGANHLVFEGYRFVQDSHNKNEDKRHWKCVEYKISKCRGRVTTQGDEVIRNNDNHNHTPSQAKISARKAVEEMKKLAKSSLEPPHQILSSVVPATSPAAQAQLPRIPAMLRTIQRQRQMVNSPVAIPQCVNNLVVPQEFQITDKGEDFLLVDEGRDSSRMIMLGTKENLVHLYSSNQIFADGTFKSCPLLFSQFFTIHGVVHGKVFPLVYVLLKNKEERTYLRMLEVLKSNVSQDPATVTTDFEQALINAFTQKFPTSRH